MHIFREPKVTLLARQEYLGAPHIQWDSDTDVPAYADVLFYGINQTLFNGYPLGSISGGTVPAADLRPMRLRERSSRGLLRALRGPAVGRASGQEPPADQQAAVTGGVANEGAAVLRTRTRDKHDGRTRACAARHGKRPG